jgi:hypothetical protein
MAASRRWTVIARREPASWVMYSATASGVAGSALRLLGSQKLRKSRQSEA